MKENVFWIFGVLQSLSIGLIISLIFQALNEIKGENVIGLDTQLLMSILCPVFILLVEYIIYKKESH